MKVGDQPWSCVPSAAHGGDRSRVEVTVETGPGGGASLTVRHHGDDNEDWATYGPGSGGTGWDLSLVGLARHLADPWSDAAGEVASEMASADGQAGMTAFADAWRDAHVAAGEQPAWATRLARAAADANRELWAGA